MYAGVIENKIFLDVIYLHEEWLEWLNMHSQVFSGTRFEDSVLKNSL